MQAPPSCPDLLVGPGLHIKDKSSFITPAPLGWDYLLADPGDSSYFVTYYDYYVHFWGDNIQQDDDILYQTLDYTVPGASYKLQFTYSTKYPGATDRGRKFNLDVWILGGALGMSLSDFTSQPTAFSLKVSDNTFLNPPIVQQLFYTAEETSTTIAFGGYGLGGFVIQKVM